MNFETRNVITGHVETTGGSFHGKVSTFSPDKLCVAVKGAGVVTDADLEKMTMTVNLKNSVGANSVILGAVPCDILASLSDYKAGWGVNTVDHEGSFFVNLGNIVLEGADELTVALNVSNGISQAYDIYIFAIDSVVGLEQIIAYRYITGTPTQTYVNANASEIYMKISDSASVDNVLQVSDYFGNATVPEKAVTAMGAVMAHSGDFDNFGTLWLDMTNLTQNVSFTCASSNERFLVEGRIFDTQRIGRGEQSLVDVDNYKIHIINSDSAKARCLGLIL